MYPGSPTLIVALCAISSHLFANDLGLAPPSSCVFSGSFEQSKSLTGLPNPLESNGTFFFHCDLGVVWKTVTPIQETLVLNNSGQSYKVADSQEIPLTSSQSKILGELMNGLIGGNSSYIIEQFEVLSNPEHIGQPSAHIHLLLVPKKRRIKRALQRIELALPTPDQSLITEQVSISMLDRNQQWTHIKSTKLLDFGNDEDAILRCYDLKAITAQECALLQATPIQ